MKQIKWGVLSTSNFGINHLIPAIRASKTGNVHAIASRDKNKADRVAKELNIPFSYGSYEELLADETIDAVYNPLPNHLHVPWTIKAMEAGKHVLCEKPIAMNSKEAELLLRKTRELPELKVMEAFMYRFHPQWAEVQSLLERQEIGTVQSFHSVFTYYNDDPENIRNWPKMGGGGLMDIGCYCISLSRFLFGSEPESVFGKLEIDPQFGVDRKASGILTFGEKTATFTCSTRTHDYQRAIIFGTDGLIEIERPFNPSGDEPAYIYLTKNGERKTIQIDSVDQYRLQVDAFTHSIINNTAVPTPVEDAVANMNVIDAVFKSDEKRSVIDL
ncbi:Gfo/Idh/MocA family protein [Rhodohalobacter barkolensis]|uniref:NAD-binding protein n=1 Tax=Rhodohalobacter barkolensis TaxID=2053187 RepID=A0A2N0VJX3_9BACT|nr:Gfo/Idh/MocA family oxidoreductase [Rhodohalobacter barkolensis]PKD44468.1 NAD-binding protein [Rhodohalobacter barkolensis]